MVVARADYNEDRRYWYIINGVNTAGDSTNRCRVQFRFMLDVSKEEEQGMALWIEDLKRASKFTPTVRSAMTLNYDLQNSRIDELSRQFPRIVENIEQRIRDEYVKEINEKNKRITELEAENRIKDEQIERLERILASRPATTTTDAPTLRPVSAPRSDEPPPELEIKASQADGGKSSANFMKSLLNIEASAKPRAEITIPQAKPTAQVVQSEERTPGNAKKLAGGDAVLSAPDFDDMDIDL